MKKDILIVEDNELSRNTLSMLIAAYGCNPLAFETGEAAIRYLDQIGTDNYPQVYFVDMRIPADLPGSERLFNYLQVKGMARNFYFVTAHLSEHDEQVLERTKANLCIKSEFNLYSLLDSLGLQ